MPDEYLSWVDCSGLDKVTDTTLPFYGIYNVAQQYGFFSNEYEENTENLISGDIEKELENI